jgi:DNA-binding SARP family transcriptional activator
VAIGSIVPDGATDHLSSDYRPHMAEFRLLGPLEVATPEGLLPLAGPKQRATLAMLLLEANRVVPADRLAEQLYDGEPPATAVTQVQRQVSELRKVLIGHATVETRSPGYALMVDPDQLDLDRFQRWLADAEEARSSGDPEEAARCLDQALAIWRGPALADLTAEPFARLPARRLEELRLLALERKLEAYLAAGRAESVVIEAQQLVAAHPTRERFAAQLMIALFRAGRQIDALAAYRELRAALVAGFGVEPGPALRELESQILRHDPVLGAQPVPVAYSGSLLVAVWADAEVGAVLAVAEPLARALRYDVLVATLAQKGDRLPEPITVASGSARTAAFTTANAAVDLARLAQEQDADVLVVPATAFEGLAAHSTAAVVEVGGRRFDRTVGAGVAVPFAGTDDDWAALEIAAALASGCGLQLRLVGPGSRDGQRDASRLLASASLAVQRVSAIQAESMLAAPHAAALAEAVTGATGVVVGARRHERWRPQIDEPLIVVHRGLRPGLLAPPEQRTHYTWSMPDRHVQGGELSAS